MSGIVNCVTKSLNQEIAPNVFVFVFLLVMSYLLILLIYFKKVNDMSPVHNVLFGQYVFLPIEQAETYLKIYVLIYHSTYILSQLVRLEGKLDFQGNRDSKFGISGSF